MAKILVTGGLGFIGSNLVKELRRRGMMCGFAISCTLRSQNS